MSITSIIRENYPEILTASGRFADKFEFNIGFIDPGREDYPVYGDANDETSFEAESPEELEELYEVFCKESGLPTDTVTYVELVPNISPKMTIARYGFERIKGEIPFSYREIALCIINKDLKFDSLSQISWGAAAESSFLKDEFGSEYTISFGVSVLKEAARQWHAQRNRLYARIAEKAENEIPGFYANAKGGYSKLSFIIDLESADLAFDLDLDTMMEADASGEDFYHDAHGIRFNIVRKDYPATDFGDFVPRFARKEN